MNPGSSPAAAGRWFALGAAAISAAACISGRVLEGYPGYPFLTFELPSAPDSSFFALQGVLEDEGFSIDFTERDSGLINTRPATRTSGDMFLTVVVAPGSAAASRVWVAGFRQVRGGADRVDPLEEAAWSDLRAVADALSERLGGTPPEAPEPPPD